ncbi:MAG: TetR/AcrR family transcriptional regulator [Bacteroidia bacterium]|nr:TetR/AcrR family transcriptional regulator [Bacteroidia bacterium]
MVNNQSLPEYSETEEKIFLAALVEFATHGRKGARMQEIAAQAGYNKALVHYYFRSKERLYEEVFAFVIRRFIKGLFDDLESAPDFPAMLRMLIERYISLLDRTPWLPKFMLRELWEGAAVLQDRLRTLFPEGSNSPPAFFIARMDEAVAKGVLRPLDPVQTLFTILGSCIFFFAAFPVFSAFLPGVDKERPRLVQERADHIYDIIMNGLLPREGMSA